MNSRINPIYTTREAHVSYSNYTKKDDSEIITMQTVKNPFKYGKITDSLVISLMDNL